MNFQSSRLWAAIAAINGGLAVGIGTYGYHKLSDDAALREVFATAVQYHMFHTLALFAVAWLAANRTERAAYWAVRAGWSFLGGIVARSMRPTYGSPRLRVVKASTSSISPTDGSTPGGSNCSLIVPSRLKALLL